MRTLFCALWRRAAAVAPDFFRRCAAWRLRWLGGCGTLAASTMVNRRLWAGLVALLGGCSLFGPPEDVDDGIDEDPPVTPPDGQIGERGKGEFLYGCVADRDPACLSSFALAFPGQIALGGQFSLNY